MSGGSVFLIRCVVVEVLGTEGWISDANYPVKHAGRVAGVPGLWLRTEDARLHVIQQVSKSESCSTVIPPEALPDVFQRRPRTRCAAPLWNAEFVKVWETAARRLLLLNSGARAWKRVERRRGMRDSLTLKQSNAQTCTACSNIYGKPTSKSESKYLNHIEPQELRPILTGTYRRCVDVQHHRCSCCVSAGR